MRYRKDGVEHELRCDFIAGCDGYHGVSRASVPPHALTTYERVYPFGWLGVLADTPPVSHELIYSNHERGFALCSMRSPTRTRYYIQCPLDDQVEQWSDDAFWDELRRRLDREAAESARHRAVDREEHRAAAQLRRRADALRAPVPRGRRRAHRAADRREGPEPRGLRRALPVARADRVLRASAATRASTATPSAACGASGRPSRFSWWFTSLMHKFPDTGAIGQKLQHAELDYLVGSRAASTAMAENYVGLPFEAPS